MPESTLYQTSSPADQVADLLGRLFDPTGGAGEGLYFGGAASLADLPGGTSYPAFLALVADDGGRLWPRGDAAPADSLAWDRQPAPPRACRPHRPC